MESMDNLEPIDSPERAMFIHRNWEGLSDAAQIGCIRIGLLQHIPLAELPKYLSSDLLEVREAANKRIEEIPIGELPKYLADSDPVVREAANDILERILDELRNGH